MSRQILITCTNPETFMGDHSESVTRAVACDPDETVGDLVGRTLTEQRYRPAGETAVVDAAMFLTIRAVDPQEAAVTGVAAEILQLIMETPFSPEERDAMHQAIDKTGEDLSATGAIRRPTHAPPEPGHRTMRLLEGDQ